jgi:hypothetical protein
MFHKNCEAIFMKHPSLKNFIRSRWLYGFCTGEKTAQKAEFSAQKLVFAAFSFLVL